MPKLSSLLGIASLLLLVGCAGSPPLSPETRRLPERVELSDVPFFQQSDAQGGASALAAVLNHYGVVSSPGLLEQRMAGARPGLSAQAGLEFAARAHDLLVYPLAPNLDALLQQVAAGNPVLVLRQQLFAWPGEQFALVVGYDQRERTLVLRSGNTRRGYIGFARFDSAWAGAGRWAVVPMPADQLPAQAQPMAWQGAAEALRKQGRAAAAERALRTARERWPDADF